MIRWIAKRIEIGKHIRQLASTDSHLRATAVESLVNIGSAAVRPLIRALPCRDSRNRSISAAEALGRLGDARAVEPLIKEIGDWGSDLVSSMTEALVRIGSASVEPLIRAIGGRLGTGPAYVRWHAVTALGELGDERAVGPLTKMIEEDSGVGDAAVEALWKLGQPQYAARVVKAPSRKPRSHLESFVEKQLKQSGMTSDVKAPFDETAFWENQLKQMAGSGKTQEEIRAFAQLMDLAGREKPLESEPLKGLAVTACKTWCCPTCGNLCVKGGLGKVFFPGESLNNVHGTATCQCGASFPQRDIYGGKYDVSTESL